MQDFRVAAITLTPRYLDVAANLRAICEWSTRAADAGAKLVLFPEGFLCGYDLETIGKTAVAIDAPQVQRIAHLAEERGVVIGFGLLERASEGFYVTQAYVGRGIRLRHRKCHRTAWEKQHCLAGNTLEVQDVQLAKLGTLICYDSAFPAAAETLVRRGAEILIQPSCHGMRAADVPPADRRQQILERKQHVLKYWRARAYDYTSYAIYLNHAGVTSRGEWFPNYVGIFGPDGEIVAEHVDEGEQMVLADLSGEWLQECRQGKVGHYRTLGDARPDLYATEAGGQDSSTP